MPDNGPYLRGGGSLANPARPPQPGLLTAMEAVRFVDFVKDSLGALILGKAREKVAAEGRNLVTAEDVGACLEDALRAMLARDEALAGK